VNSKLRRGAAATLVLLTLVPEALTVPILGYVNLAFTILLWAASIALSKALKTKSFAAAVVFAIAMAMPPVPYYVSVVNGNTHFEFLGLDHVADSGWEIAYRFVIYLLICACVVWLLAKRQDANLPIAGT